MFEPVGVALDVLAGKMYWTEASPADFMISRANLDGSNAELLVTGLTSPSGIALDVSSAACPADLDGDGEVRVPDLIILLAAWGPVPTPDPPDFDGDGEVRVPDLIILLAAWGLCT